MSDLVGNPEDRFSNDKFHMVGNIENRAHVDLRETQSSAKDDGKPAKVVGKNGSSLEVNIFTFLTVSCKVNIIIIM